MRLLTRLVRRQGPTPNEEKEELERKAADLERRRQENERRLRVLEAQSRVFRRQ